MATSPPPRTYGANENLVLTDAELEACRPVAGEGGQTLRAFCPFHGSDHQRSLRVNLETGHFKCFACEAWGYLQRSRDARRAGPAPYGASPGQAPMRSPTHPPRPRPAPPPPARPELADVLAGYQTALPGSPGAAYLRERGIGLELAQARGVGYAAPGAWAHRDKAGRPLRDWHRGRLVFAHTDPAGNVVNLYGRAVGDAPKETRHDHLPGPKGAFNAPALRDGAGPVAVCEGAFDALALMAAGLGRAVAIFGASGWRWEWARDAGAFVFALDADATGQGAWRDLARAARLRGKRVAFLPPDAYGGRKDVADAWAAGVLRLGAWPAGDESPPSAADRPQRPAQPDTVSAPAPLAAPAALAFGLEGAAALSAAQLAETLSRDSVEGLSELWEDTLQTPESDPDRAIWLTAIAEAYTRRDC